MPIKITVKALIRDTLINSGYFEELSLPTTRLSATELISFHQSIEEVVNNIALIQHEKSSGKFCYLSSPFFIMLFKREYPFQIFCPDPVRADSILFCGANHKKKQFKILLRFLEKELFNARNNNINLLNSSQTLALPNQFKERLTNTIYESFLIQKLMTASLESIDDQTLLQLSKHLAPETQVSLETAEKRERLILELTFLKSKISFTIDRFYQHYQPCLINYIDCFAKFIHTAYEYTKKQIDLLLRKTIQQILQTFTNTNIQPPTPSLSDQLCRRLCYCHHQSYIIQLLNQLDQINPQQDSLQTLVKLTKDCLPFWSDIQRAAQQEPNRYQQPIELHLG